MSKLVSTHGTTIYDFCPVGAIIAFPATAIPAGWLECNGQAVSITIFTDLFGLIGTTYGAGDESTTFNLPDYRGVFLRGNDNGRGYDAGRALGSFQESSKIRRYIYEAREMQIFNPDSVEYSSSSYYGANNASTSSNEIYGIRPKNVSVVFCIKATMARTASATTAATFASLTHNTHQGEVSSLAANGYKRFADGTIIQWGGVSGISGQGPYVINFPVAFGAACYSVVATANSGAGYDTYELLSVTTTSFTAYKSINQVGGFYWQSVGR